MEVLSEGNTPAEMDRKLREVLRDRRPPLVLDPPSRTARVYTALDQVTTLSDQDVLEGGDVLPGFRLRVGDWLDRAGRRQSR